MGLTGKTQIVGIFGDPVEHSLSPLMQNAAIQAQGIDAVYVPFRVTSAQLCDAINGIKALNIRGVNLTIPHKEAACDLVDELDEQASLIGAINTIVNTGGRLKGYNTDGVGLLKALKQALDVDVTGKDILLLGAGGACRAALVALCQAGVSSVGIANRTRERSQSLIKEFAPRFKGTAFAEYELSPTLCEAALKPVDLLINTSAVGLNGEGFGFEITKCLKKDGGVYDMVYASAPTPLASEATGGGYVFADGLAMLAGQGEAAFELWFGTAPQKAIMRQALERST